MSAPGSHRVSITAPEDLPTDFPAPLAILALAETMIAELCRLDALDQAFALEISVIDDAAMAQLNQAHRAKSGPTDVLSFPMLDFPAGVGAGALPRNAAGRAELGDLLFGQPPDEPALLGDIVIARETCERQAAEIGHSVRDEFLRLLSHGLLHLFGYDHETSSQDEARMREREDQLLAVVD